MRNLSSSKAGSSSKIPCLGCYMTVCFKTQKKILSFGLSFKLIVQHYQEPVSLKSRCCSDKSFLYILVSPSQSLHIAVGFMDEVDTASKRGSRTPCGRGEWVCLLWTGIRSRVRPNPQTGNDQVTRLCKVEDVWVRTELLLRHKALGSHRHLLLRLLLVAL